MSSRDEFERRLLALVRDYMDVLDEEYHGGWEIGDFIVAYDVRAAPADDAQLRAWDHPRYTGWDAFVAVSSSARGQWVTEALLDAAVSAVAAPHDEVDDAEA